MDKKGLITQDVCNSQRHKDKDGSSSGSSHGNSVAVISTIMLVIVFEEKYKDTRRRLRPKSQKRY